MEKAQILIVEDDAIIAMDIECQLRKLGYGVTGIVGYGEQAIEKVKENKPDLVLMDIILKGEMDGIEAAAAIHTQFDIPIIFLTAYADKKRLERAKLTYPFGFILKPFQNKDLEVTIEMALYVAKVDVKRKQAEKELRESEERYKTVFEGAAGGILIADIETKAFRYANPATCRMLGYTEEKLKRMNVLDLHPKESLEHVISEFEAQSRGEKTLATNIPFLKKDGSIIYVDVNTSKLLVDGKTCNVGFLANITERKQAEEELKESEKKFRGLIERLKDVLYRMSLPDGAYEYFSPAATSVFGYSSKKFIDKPLFIREIVHPDYIDYFQKKWSALLEGKIPPTYEYKIIDPEGNERWILQSNNGVFDHQGNIIAIEGICRNITASKQAEEALRKG
jgi:PAS domain S-box-containing protein